MQYFSVNDCYWNSAWVSAGHNHAPCTITPYISIGEFDTVFGSPVEFGSDSPLGHAYDPPATSVLQTEKTLHADLDIETVEWSDELVEVLYGILLNAPANAMGCFIAKKFWITLHLDDAYKYAIETEYKKIPFQSEVLTQYMQTPIKADDLDFRSSLPLPERSEIALVKDRTMVFRGVVWSAEDVNQSYKILARSQQALLDYRLIDPDFVPNSGMTVKELFSDEDEWNYIGYEFEYDWYNKYYYSANGLFYFLNSWKGGFLSSVPEIGWSADLDSHAVDTALRPGTNDFDSVTIPASLDVNGVAATVFSNIFRKYGQEVRYRYDWDGLVYQDAAVKIANGSEDNPLISVVDGKNGWVTKRIPSVPAYTSVVGSSLNPKLATTWERARQYFASVMTVAAIAGDLQEYLDVQFDDDNSQYDVSLPYENWLLRPGDYIVVQPRDYPPTPTRIRQITTGNGKTKILSGRKLLNLNEQFGIFRDAKYALHTYTDLKIDEISESTDLTLSKEFTVSDDLANPGWQCKALIDWDFVIRNLIYEGGLPDWVCIYSGTPPYPVQAYIQVAVPGAGDNYHAYGAHAFTFQITRNMTAFGIEPYGPNDVEVVTTNCTFNYRLFETG